MEVLTVIWSSGSCDDHGNAHSFAGVHGIYKSEASAQQGLEECKQEMLDEIYTDLDPDNEFPGIRDEVQINGSNRDGYYEISYVLGTEPVMIYIGITSAHVQN
jgi:hypothetical protein